MFRAQIKELEDVLEMQSINKAALNSFTIKQYSNIKSLLEVNLMNRVLDSNANVQAP